MEELYDKYSRELDLVLPTTEIFKKETSAINSPFFNVFLAAQIHGSNSSLLMNGTKVRDLITTMGDIHYIFPEGYLKKNGITDKSKYNQIANYTYLDTQTNISIGEKAPNYYFKTIAS